MRTAGKCNGEIPARVFPYDLSGGCRLPSGDQQRQTDRGDRDADTLRRREVTDEPVVLGPEELHDEPLHAGDEAVHPEEPAGLVGVLPEGPQDRETAGS